MQDVRWVNYFFLVVMIIVMVYGLTKGWAESKTLHAHKPSTPMQSTTTMPVGTNYLTDGKNILTTDSGDRLLAQ